MDFQPPPQVDFKRMPRDYTLKNTAERSTGGDMRVMLKQVLFWQAGRLRLSLGFIHTPDRQLKKKRGSPCVNPRGTCQEETRPRSEPADAGST